MEKEIGTITHWFDKIGVAVIALKAPLAKGDHIKVRHGGEEFEDTVESIQIDHEEVDKAKKGDDAAIKLSQKAKEHSIVFAA